MTMTLTLSLKNLEDNRHIFKVDRGLNIQSPTPWCCTLSIELLLLENITKQRLITYRFTLLLTLTSEHLRKKLNSLATLDKDNRKTFKVGRGLNIQYHPPLCCTICIEQQLTDGKYIEIIYSYLNLSLIHI